MPSRVPRLAALLGCVILPIASLLGPRALGAQRDGSVPAVVATVTGPPDATNDPGMARGPRGAVASRRAPVRWATVSANYFHTCALTVDGDAYCWGRGYPWAPLGNGRTSASPIPTAVLTRTGEKFASISTGARHSCALAVTGLAYCWGLNRAGPLGTADTIAELVPVPVETGRVFLGIAAAYDYSCALSAPNLETSLPPVPVPGRVFCWGANGLGELGIGQGTGQDTTRPNRFARGAAQLTSGLRDIVALDGRAQHSCALRGARVVFCWGSNSYGQLGSGTPGGYSATAVRVQGDSLFSLDSLVQLAVGSTHSCALARSGGAFCWGNNVGGQLGDGSQVNRLTPVRVQGAVAFTSLSAGGGTCGVGTDSLAYCWGMRWTYNVGAPPIVPTLVTSQWRFRSVSVGNAYACGVTTPDDAIICWGIASHYQLGRAGVPIDAPADRQPARISEPSP